jgi:hypothetical protein
MVNTDGGREGRPGTRRRRRNWTPEVSALEGRALQTVVILKGSLTVHPGVLRPTANGQPELVTVTGQALETSAKATPTGSFHVTDEYRRYEPFGPMTLTPAGTYLTTNNRVFDFQLTLRLPTNRSTRTPDGRHFDIALIVKDQDNTDSHTVEALVPKTYPPPLHGQPHVAGPRARTKPG